jgi:hypothetical protein
MDEVEMILVNPQDENMVRDAFRKDSRVVQYENLITPCIYVDKGHILAMNTENKLMQLNFEIGG